MLEITKSSVTFATFTSRVGNKDFLVQEGFLHSKMYVAKLYPNSTHLGFFFSFASRLSQSWILHEGNFEIPSGRKNWFQMVMGAENRI